MRGRVADGAGLVLAIAICLGIGALAAAVTAAGVDDWYPALAKPSFTPPEAIFGPVWTVLYVLMGVAVWRVWRAVAWERARGAITTFALQLVFNLGWSIAFFGLRSIAIALAVIVALDLLVVATALLFRRIDRWAALLLVPYLAWIAFATVLNLAIWRLN